MEMPTYYDHSSEYYHHHHHHYTSSSSSNTADFLPDSFQTMHIMSNTPPQPSIHHNQIHHFPIPTTNQQHYSNSNSYYCMATFTGHTSYISSISFVGKHIYTGSSDGEIRAWKRNPNDIDQEFSNHNHNEDDDYDDNVVAVGKGAVKSMVMLSNHHHNHSHTLLFSAHQDHKIRVWRISSSSSQHQRRAERIATLPTLGDRTIKLLNPNNQVQIRRHKSSTWCNHVDSVSALALSHDQSLLYSVSWDRTLKIWRISDFKCLESVPNAHDDAINALAVSPDEDVYTGSADHKIKVWRRRRSSNNNKQMMMMVMSVLEKHRSSVNALVLSDDGSVLYSGSSDKSILVWKKKKKTYEENDDEMVVAGMMRGHTKAVLCLAVAADLVCSGSADKTIRVWRNNVNGNSNFSCLRVLEGHRGPVKCVAMATSTTYYQSDTSSSDCSDYVVYSGGLDCDVKVWQVSVSLY